MPDRIDDLLEQLGSVLAKLQKEIGDRDELLRERARIYAAIDLLKPGAVAASSLEPGESGEQNPFNRIQ